MHNLSELFLIMFRWQCIYEETSVCLSIFITPCSCLSFSHSPSFEISSLCISPFHAPSPNGSLTLIVVVLVPFFKPSQSVSYQTPDFKKTDPGSLASQHDSASVACQPPQAHRSQISTLIWIIMAPVVPVVQTARLGFQSQLLQPNICHVER